MGIKVYYIILVMVIALGLIMTQTGMKKKHYVILMAIMHTFVCGFRYQYLTGDLQKYEWNYVAYQNYGWLSDEIVQEGRNTGFQMLMKLVSMLTNGNFQVFLMLIAIIIEIILAIFIYRYSPKPWLSYLVWNCMGFYIFGFSAIKQALAMAIVMWAMMAVFERKPVKFLVLTLLACFVHMPAIAFLPAYWLARRRVKFSTIMGYVAAVVVIFLFKDQIVSFISNIYYEEETIEMFQNSSDGLGGRFFLIVLILLCGVILKGFHERNFEALFHVIIVAAIFQMFSGVDNVFTRFADYYLQFTVLFIPMMFYEQREELPVNRSYMRPLLPFNDRSIQILVAILAMVLIWYYYGTCLGVPVANATDDYLNFRFMWDVTS